MYLKYRTFCTPEIKCCVDYHCIAMFVQARHIIRVDLPLLTGSECATFFVSVIIKPKLLKKYSLNSYF